MTLSPPSLGHEECPLPPSRPLKGRAARQALASLTLAGCGTLVGWGLLAGCGGGAGSAQDHPQAAGNPTADLAGASASTSASLTPHKGRALVRPDGTRVDPVTHIPVDAPVSPRARRKLREFLEAMVQPPLDATSDIHDEWFHRTTAMRKALMAADEDVGNAALHAFCGDATDFYDARRALLMIGASAAPKSAAPLFHELTWNYGYRIEDRSEACQLLGAIDPEGFFEHAEPFLTRRGRPTRTMPPDEFLLRGWLAACEKSGRSPVEMCADVATNLWMEPYARYMAVEELGLHPSNPLARRAMETCLIESTGDGVLRIKAAQSIAAGYPREEACALFQSVYDKEVSINFKKFLADLIAANCGTGEEDPAASLPGEGSR